MKTSYRIDGFTERLEKAIFDSGKDLNQIAKESGVHRSNIWFYRFDHKMPSCYSLMRLATTLNVSTDWLLGLKG